MMPTVFVYMDKNMDEGMDDGIDEGMDATDTVHLITNDAHQLLLLKKWLSPVRT